MTGCRERALRLLASRAHFRAELARKLAARGYAAAEVEGTLAELAERGYLDDERTARELVAERRERRGWGRTRLRAELLRRGAPRQAADAALAALSSGDELELARATAARLARRGPPAAPALGRQLARKGFSRHVILAVLAEAGGGDEAAFDGAESEAGGAVEGWGAEADD